MFVKFWEMFEDAMQCYGCWRAFNHFDPIMYHHRKCPTRQSSVSRDLSSQSLIAHVIVMSCTERPDNNDPLVYCGFNVYFPLLLLCEQKFIVWLDIFFFEFFACNFWKLCAIVPNLKSADFTMRCTFLVTAKCQQMNNQCKKRKSFSQLFLITEWNERLIGKYGDFNSFFFLVMKLLKCWFKYKYILQFYILSIV